MLHAQIILFLNARELIKEGSADIFMIKKRFLGLRTRGLLSADQYRTERIVLKVIALRIICVLRRGGQKICRCRCRRMV